MNEPRVIESVTNECQSLGRANESSSARAEQLIACLEGEIAKRDARIDELESRYQRDVYGLNNEGDPIGGDPAGGYANDNARLRTELAAIKAGQGEAVAWIVTDMNGDSYFAYDRQTPSDTPLYAAPVSVAKAQGVVIDADDLAQFIREIDGNHKMGAGVLAEHIAEHIADSLNATPVQQVMLADTRHNRLYLAGPMTGIEDYNFPAFNAEATRLRATGLHVENPAEHGIVDGADWADYLRYDIGRLATCEKIHLLPGWSQSKGVKLELQIAQSLGMGICYAEGAEEVAPVQQASVPDGSRLVTTDWLKRIHRDLDACQKLIWANLRGCDPSYYEDAQERLREIDAMLAAALSAGKDSDQ